MQFHEDHGTPARSIHSVRDALQQSRVFWAGLVLLILGTGPLVVIVILDPQSNPIGPGLLAFFTVWPSIAMITVGVLRALRRARA